MSNLHPRVGQDADHDQGDQRDDQDGLELFSMSKRWTHLVLSVLNLPPDLGITQPDELTGGSRGP